MGLKDELTTYTKEVFTSSWDARDGQKVPTPEEVGHGSKAVKLDATVLYADLAGSTKLVESTKNWFAAGVYKSYLYCAAKIIRANGGEITAYDGDRVMAVFIGDSKNTSAAKTGLQIYWATKNIVLAHYNSLWPDLEYELKQRVGIATSDLFIARTGIRGHNDLVWVGNAANHAAKMAALPTDYATYITSDVYNQTHDSSKLGGPDGTKNMWTDLGNSALGYKIYGSNWSWGL